MSEEDFSKLSLLKKWEHVASIMDYIIATDSTYQQSKVAYDLRRRYNPHHPESQVKEEKRALAERQRNLRTDQYQRWGHVKNLYATHRDEMADTLGNPKYEEFKHIIENVFTMEFDDALRDVIE